jgi:hypothetical protein
VGGPQTGAGGASLSGDPNDLLVALGATLLAGSLAAMGMAVRRIRLRTFVSDNPRGDSPGENL